MESHEEEDKEEEGKERGGGRSHEGGADTFPSPTWANWVEGIPALHNLATISPQK